MNNEEAKTILSTLLGEYRAKSYEELKNLLSLQDVSEVDGDSGTRYQVEFQAVWDDKEGRNIRVIGAIDDGGIRSLMPLTEDFIVAPNGEFIGE